MVKRSFFSDGEAADVIYDNIRAARNQYTATARETCEALWEKYEAFADREFLTEIRSNFIPRYWEMYLANTFISAGYEIFCPKPGPDVGIKVGDVRVWLEATCPTRGEDGSPDQVPKRKVVAVGELPIVQDVPNERMVLRYLNSIASKYNEQYMGWRKDGIVAPEDVFVIALNPRKLEFEHADTQPPRILQAAFAIGNPYAVIDRDTLKQIDAGYQVRDKISKFRGGVVNTGVFHLPEYNQLSGLLCSRVDGVNQSSEMGLDFQLVPNPNAKNPLPDLQLKGTFFRVKTHEGEYTITPEKR